MICLNLFAGAIYADGNLYILFSRIARDLSKKEQYEEIVIGLGKYDKSGNQIAYKEYPAHSFSSGSVSEEGVKIPFYGGVGTPSLTYSNGEIGLFFSSNRFDGHQASKLSFFNSNTLQNLSYIIDDGIEVKDFRRYYYVFLHFIGHSFGQRLIKTSDNGYLIVEQGDDFLTRGLIVTKFYEVTDDQGYISLNKQSRKMANFSEYPATVGGGNNTINSTLGNIIELDDGYMYIGAMDPILSKKVVLDRYNPWQLFVQKYDKNFHLIKDNKQIQLLDAPERTVSYVGREDLKPSNLLNPDTVDYGMKFLTNNTNTTILMVRATKLDDNKIAIIWEEDKEDGIYYSNTDYDIYYMVIDSNGDVVIPKTILKDTKMSGLEHYIYKDGYVYWTTTEKSSKIVTINKLNVSENDLKGDLNNNRELDLTDVLLGIKIYFGSIEANEYQKNVGDMNDDDKIDLTDILLLLKSYFVS